jgi:exopolysaccharide biosynthesis polyprenyl glycosylphosphotransferase
MLVSPLANAVSGDHGSFRNDNEAGQAKAESMTGYQAWKRVFDSVVVTLGLIALSPLFVILALLIKLDSDGPVLFSQMRVGKHGKLFRCWKFRSMSSDAENLKQSLQESNEMVGGVTFKINNDPRITRVGRLIRKASIDELPQLWNVLRGDMALVGPRPAVPSEVENYTAHQRRRLAVLPGITCLWQVSGRSKLPFHEQVRLDIEYIENRSLLTDLAILLRTIPAVITARGAC